MANNNFREHVTATLIDQIQAGSAPWQKPWEAGQFRVPAFNPANGKPTSYGLRRKITRTRVGLLSGRCRPTAIRCAKGKKGRGSSAGNGTTANR